MSETSGVSETAGTTAKGGRRRRVRTMTATLGMILLGSQLLVTFLSALAILGLRLVPLELGIPMGIVLLVLQLAAIAVLQFKGSPLLGWIVEILCVLAGFVHPGMFVVGGMFLAAWIYCMRQGAKVDAVRAPVIAAYERALSEGATEEEAKAAAQRVMAGEEPAPEPR